MVEVLILKKRKDFVRAAKGLKLVAPSLILQAAQSFSSPQKTAGEDCCFLGFTATKKLGKATYRNRTKRRLRAAARDIFARHGRPNTDYVLIGRYNTATVDYKQLREDMKYAVKKINKQFIQDQQKAAANENPVDSAD